MDFGKKTILMILWSEFTTVVHSYCGSQFCVFAYVSDNKFILAMLQGADNNKLKPRPLYSCACALQGVLLQAALVTLYKKNALLIEPKQE